MWDPLLDRHQAGEESHEIETTHEQGRHTHPGKVPPYLGSEGTVRPERAQHTSGEDTDDSVGTGSEWEVEVGGEERVPGTGNRGVHVLALTGKDDRGLVAPNDGHWLDLVLSDRPLPRPWTRTTGLFL